MRGPDRPASRPLRNAAMFFALNTKLAVKAGLVAVSLGAAAMNAAPSDPSRLAPATITLSDINLSFRPAGDFQRDGEPTDAPLQQRHFDKIEIMKAQVSAAEYAACVADDACAATSEQGAEN